MRNTCLFAVLLMLTWSQHLAVETPYGKVNQTLEKILGFQLSVDSLEQTSRKMASPVVDYLDHLAAPPGEEEGELLVSSTDGKGMPIRGASWGLPKQAVARGRTF